MEKFSIAELITLRDIIWFKIEKTKVEYLKLHYGIIYRKILKMIEIESRIESRDELE